MVLQGCGGSGQDAWAYRFRETFSKRVAVRMSECPPGSKLKAIKSVIVAATLISTTPASRVLIRYEKLK